MQRRRTNVWRQAMLKTVMYRSICSMQVYNFAISQLQNVIYDWYIQLADWTTVKMRANSKTKAVGNNDEVASLKLAHIAAK